MAFSEIVLVAILMFLPVAGQVPAAAASTGSLTGRVLDGATGAPLAGARVTVVPGGPRTGMVGPPSQAMTDQDGRFLVASLAPGDYRVTVMRTGYASDPDRSRPPLVTVLEGKATVFDVHLQKGGAITGRVVDASGAPVPDLRVMALRRVDVPQGFPSGGTMRLLPAGGQGGQTNDLGEFRIASLAAGEYYIAATPAMGSPFGGAATTASARTTANTTTYYPGTIDQAAAQPIRVAAGDTAGNIEFPIQSTPTYRVSGRVVDEEGNPVAGAMLMLINDMSAGGMPGPVGNGRSGGDGRFSIAGVPSGKYRLTASVPMRSSGASGATAGADAGVSAGGFVSWSSGSGWASNEPAEVLVRDGDVPGIRIVARRPQ